MSDLSRSASSRSRDGSVGHGWRLFHGEIDGVLLGTVIALLAIGLLMMFSASYPAAIEDGHKGTFYAYRQMIFAIGGLILMAFASAINYHFYEKLWVSWNVKSSGP